VNILFYGSGFPPIPYGASRYFDNLSRALVGRGHGVTIVTAVADGVPDYEERDGMHIHRIGTTTDLRTADAAKTTLGIAAEAGSDLIQGVEYLGECASILRQVDRPPVCIKVISSISMRVLRGSLAFYAWQRPLVTLACLRAWRQWRDERVCMSRADLAFAATERVFRELDQQNARVTDFREVIPNPVRVPAVWENAEAAEPTLLYVGRLDFGKGLGWLPAILREVSRTVPNVRLVLAGGDTNARCIGSVETWLRSRFGDEIQRVRFMGSLQQEELDACYRQAWVVIVPSRWDSCSNVTLEAMARAKPVVVSPHGGMPELVAGTNAPIAAPDAPAFSAAVVSLLADETGRESLGNALQSRAKEKFSLDRVADQYCDFAERYLERSSSKD